MKDEKKKTYTVVRQAWEESERGWGQKLDGYSLHLTEKDRAAYIKEYWAGMPKSTPDVYERPCGQLTFLDVDEKVYKQIVESGGGIRIWD